MLNYNEIATGNDVLNYVRKFWIVNNENNPFATPPKYALPNGCFTVAFISGEGVTLRSNNEYFDIGNGIYFFGQISIRLEIVLKANTKAIMAQLNPWAAIKITNCPLSALTDTFVELALLNKEIFNAVNNINYADERTLIPEFCKILEQQKTNNNDPNLVQYVFNFFEDKLTGAPVKLNDIAIHTGYSPRYIEKKFSTQVGLSPAQAYSILRLRKIIDDLDTLPGSLTLGQLAYKYGYFDQAHFIRSYQKVMNEQPKKFNSDDHILPFS
jgi:AraC-like DNA-binding protein